MKTNLVNGQNGVATSANTSFSLYATSLAKFGYHKRIEFTELNKTELVRFIAQPISMYKSDAHYCLEFGDERYCIYIYKNEKGYYVTVHETSSKTVQRPVKEVIRHYCDCFRLTEKKIDNIINYIYDLVANYFNGFYQANITKSEFDKEYTDNLNSPDTLNVNSQIGVATSAKEMFKNKFEGLMYVDQTSFTLDEIGSWTLEQKQGLLDKVRRMRMNNCSSKEFVYNNIKFNFNWGVAPSTGERVFKIYATIKTNGRYDYGSIIALRKFPNNIYYHGTSSVLKNDMCDLVGDMLVVADIAKAEWDRGYGFNSPDALNNDIESIMEFFGNDYKTLNDIENEFFGYHFDIDNELRDNLRFKRNGTFIEMYYKDMTIINNSEYIRLTDIKTIRDFEKALYELISTLINDNENEGGDVSVVDQVVNFIVEKESGDDGVCYLYDIGYEFSCFDWKVDKELIEAWHGPIKLDIKEYSDIETYCINLLDNNGYEIGYIDMDQVDTWEDFQIEIENQLECIRAHTNDMIEGVVSLDKSVVMEAFEIADAQGESSLKIDYEDWWESYVSTSMYDIYDSEYIADYMYSNYFEGFCENLLEQFKKFAKDYDYGVEEIDGGISLEKPDYNN
jgi:hypothetical protein